MLHSKLKCLYKLYWALIIELKADPNYSLEVMEILLILTFNDPKSTQSPRDSKQH